MKKITVRFHKPLSFSMQVEDNATAKEIERLARIERDKFDTFFETLSVGIQEVPNAKSNEFLKNLFWLIQNMSTAQIDMFIASIIAIVSVSPDTEDTD